MTPLSSFGRRTAVIAASSGLVVAMGITVADASPVATSNASTVTTAQPVSAPRAAAASPKAAVVAPVVSVAVDATASLARVTFPAAVPPPPPPPPPPVVEERQTQQASRSSSRSPVADSSAGSNDAAPAASSSGDASGIRGQILATARSYLGIPYVYGGTSTGGFDCSGFTQFVYSKVGISLPRTSGAQGGAGTRVSRSEAQPGDLAYKPGHIGIYAGGNMMIDSPSSGGVTAEREMWADFQFIRVV